MAGLDKIDPANPCLACGVIRGAGSAHDGRVGLQPYQEMPARELDEEIPVVGEYALRRRTEVVGKVRVLKS